MSLREGGVYEEVALLNALASISRQADEAIVSLRELCSVLYVSAFSPTFVLGARKKQMVFSFPSITL
jgi:hypothetical protein